MRRLYTTLRSPFGRKVLLHLHARGLPVAVELVDLAHRSPEFVALNAHGKVPVLVDEDGTVVCDSTVICEYIEDRHPSGPARGWRARLAVREIEDLADDLADQAVTLFFAKADEARAEKAGRTATRLMQELEARAPASGLWFLDHPSYADAAVLSALGYWTLRHGDAWRAAHPRLAAWYDRADAQPAAVETRPRLG